MNDLEWRNNIDELKKIKKTDISKNEIYRALKKSILNILPNENFGILLSGGVDSSLIAKICKDEGLNFRCFRVGAEDSQDLIAAKETSQILNLELIARSFELEEIENLLQNRPIFH